MDGRFAAGLAGLAVVAATLVPSGGADATGSATCGGQPATLVGTPGGTVTGTAGPDVIVTNGASRVNAGAGDDLICVTGRRVAALIDAGVGDDSVDTTAAKEPIQADLGPGADTFQGGAQGDDIFAGTAPTDQKSVDTDHDTIRAGAGADQVITGDQADPAASNDDTVALGGGDDSLVVFADSGAATLDGGAGQNRMTVDTCCLGQAMLVDNRAQEIRSGPQLDHVVARYRGAFDRFTFYQRYPSMSFRGSDRGERLFFDPGEGYSHPKVPYTGTLAMGGGDDRIWIQHHAFHGWIHGGAGRDFLQVFSRATNSVVADLGEGITTDGQRRTGLAGVESLSLGLDRAASVRVVGTSRSNRIEVFGDATSTRIEGKGGDDHIFAGYNPYDPTASALVHGGHGNDTIHGWAHGDRLYGGPGADRLSGEAGADRLFGGRGHDHAYGGSGRDRCSAEARTSC